MAVASIRRAAQAVLPTGAVGMLRSGWRKFCRARAGSQTMVIRLFNSAGLNVALSKDYYSPLPVLRDLKRNRSRWDKPSELVGINVDVADQRRLFDQLWAQHGREFLALPAYESNRQRGFGPGYPHADAMLLYLMMRSRRPRRYLEVGSGLSTYYAGLAAEHNASDGAPVSLTCIEPFPFPALRSLPQIRLIVDEVQNVPLTAFEELEAGDLFFIDSSHSLKIDSDVTFLYLEVLPRLKPGVLIHIHDIPFPYNTPRPVERWVLGPGWPRFWTEAMVLQAFLCFNDRFRILLSQTMVNGEDPTAVKRFLPDYDADEARRNSPSSIWLERVK